MAINSSQSITESQQRNSVSPQSSVSNLLGSAVSWGSKAFNNIAGSSLGKAVVEEVANATGFGRLLRSNNLPSFGMPNGGGFSEASWGSQRPDDWRVRLSIPPNFSLPGPLGSKLSETNGMVFPFTPQIILQHSAQYGQMRPVHSNYPFPVYQSSQVDQMTITGEFYVENADEAIYWIAAVHYLRAVTKMAYGETSNQGSPPPVVRLNGYGDFVLKNVPVVITVFNVDLPSDVDYIHVPNIGPQGTWVPTRSQISVSAQPVYSRRAVQSFSLDKFIAGGYANSNGVGFI
jgi:hypothetical protein